MALAMANYVESTADDVANAPDEGAGSVAPEKPRTQVEGTNAKADDGSDSKRETKTIDDILAATDMEFIAAYCGAFIAQMDHDPCTFAGLPTGYAYTTDGGPLDNEVVMETETTPAETDQSEGERFFDYGSLTVDGYPDEDEVDGEDKGPAPVINIENVPVPSDTSVTKLEELKPFNSSTMAFVEGGGHDDVVLGENQVEAEIMVRGTTPTIKSTSSTEAGDRADTERQSGCPPFPSRAATPTATTFGPGVVLPDDERFEPRSMSSRVVEREPVESMFWENDDDEEVEERKVDPDDEEDDDDDLAPRYPSDIPTPTRIARRIPRGANVIIPKRGGFDAVLNKPFVGGGPMGLDYRLKNPICYKMSQVRGSPKAFAARESLTESAAATWPRFHRDSVVKGGGQDKEPSGPGLARSDLSFEAEAAEQWTGFPFFDRSYS